MRHHKLNKRFGRSKSARKELIQSLARNALIYSRIKTTLPKAKEASRLLDRLISLGKEETVHARRQAFDVLQDRSLVLHLVKDIAPLFKNRNGGYTRVIQLNNRRGDGAQMAILELVEKVKKEPKPKKEKPIKPKEKVKPEEEKLEEPTPPKEKPPKPEEAKPKPKKEGLFSRIISRIKGLFSRIKGIFKKKKD